ncbi:5' nucleotidase, NT5C type [Intestinibacter sp.]|uniref:5' nucleotidase, NT5C type n=1 Tax=Intestinibacter sp. TaxID=1965304 RepID=UPI002A74C5B9|nr:hydrolase [Intestinibacter sp.]MDY2738190.1 hydrolase [Intestinibacter sp.]MDY4574982.1 hydrolase [Intestinibacter sp.]
MKNLNICIDIDGTVTSPYHYMPYLNSIYNRNLTEEDFTTVFWAELYGDTLEGMLDKLHSNYLNSYSEAKVVEGAKEVIDELYKENNLSFVTARSADLEEITRNWLKKQQLSHVPLYLLGTDKKLDKAKELKCDIFIEDHPKNALHLAEGGIKVILIDCNYNKNVEHENIIRVSCWKEIKGVIDKL